MISGEAPANGRQCGRRCDLRRCEPSSVASHRLAVMDFFNPLLYQFVRLRLRWINIRSWSAQSSAGASLFVLAQIVSCGIPLRLKTASW